ncbi:hypothetical protein MKZ20_01605 [Psychrobacillus sp. FSL K6-2684]|uniref:DUF4064 domain-containing protein n=1 Tax=Psychrobacillus faecigallinarum TaxID=2762235 RepID=A0ABR8R8Z1_9BACI|nr:MULTISPECIES: hypothetical protein [Psychrobacillus]MBD7944274.1 hypothetical protein [Psychrobacillus faecigallinarum]QEY21130.1 hypothetical protein D0S48_10720 [Psychrobacillus sp. AK 1817]QGM31643.1 hypothetical protein GI482_15190 [Bacillus sp. N3536]
MELVTLKRFDRILNIAGWIGILSGLAALFFLNIGILTNFAIDINSLYSIAVGLTIILSVLALFSRTSRSLGVWGIGLGVFLMLFQTVIFFLGWMVIPFP